MDERATSTALGWQPGAWGVLSRLEEADGSAGHPWFRRLLSGPVQQRDLGDAVHALCSLYGHHPGPADEALIGRALPVAEHWLADVSTGFAVERGYLARLTAGAGPLPSTPGHAEAMAALSGQRHALSMLARSDRGGCAVGAVAALVLDWQQVRLVMEVAAERFSVPLTASAMPSASDTASVVATLGAGPSAERAVAFGAQQLLAQHRGLWSLLEARASARHD